MQELTGSTPKANLLTGLGVDETFSRTDVSGARHFLTDALGSTLALTDGAGTVQTSYSYEPYGKTTASGTASGNSIEYTGRENDSTGLYFYRARYYHPGLQRFVAEDPIGLAGGINQYLYVRGNPISYIDPLGLLDRLVFDGKTLTGYDDFAVEFSVPAVSGPWGKGELPEGTYSGNNLRKRKDNKAMICPDGSGWSLDLDPTFNTDRTLLRIHPDGNVPGTEGCIGPSCLYQQQVYDALKNYFGDGRGATSVPVIVRYPK